MRYPFPAALATRDPKQRRCYWKRNTSKSRTRHRRIGIMSHTYSAWWGVRGQPVICIGCEESAVDEAYANRDRHRVSPVCSSELAHCGLHMLIDGALGDAEYFANLPCGFSARDPGQNFGFARCQRAVLGSRSTRRCTRPPHIRDVRPEKILWRKPEDTYARCLNTARSW